MNTLLTACIVLLLTTAAAAEETVYRCGPDGHQYSQAPCPSGTAVDVADPRTPDQQREARSASARDARLAHELVQERRLRETTVAYPGAAYLVPLRASGADSSATQHPRKRKANHKAGEDPRLTLPLRSTTERR